MPILLGIAFEGAAALLADLSDRVVYKHIKEKHVAHVIASFSIAIIVVMGKRVLFGLFLNIPFRPRAHWHVLQPRASNCALLRL